MQLIYIKILQLCCGCMYIVDVWYSPATIYTSIFFMESYCFGSIPVENCI